MAANCAKWNFASRLPSKKEVRVPLALSLSFGDSFLFFSLFSSFSIVEVSVTQMQHCVVYDPEKFLMVEIISTYPSATMGEIIHSSVRVAVTSDPGNTKVNVNISGDVSLHQFMQQSSNQGKCFFACFCLLLSRCF